MKNIEEKLKKIKLLAMDFDGVLTDNKVFIDEDGKEMVICDRSDSLGIKMLRKEKKDVGIIVISKETSKVVKARCEKLHIEHLTGIDDKLEALKGIIEQKKLKFENVAYIGNDVNDIECIQNSGIGVAVADSANKVLEVADIVTTKKGGHGAVREFCDMLLHLNSSNPTTYKI
ncbi:HAD hydrolase family protein [candidate division WOR-3 bacterium]|nr:HAD hydrolase family protein [candidate division WOR-3 bacterium]